MCYRNWRNNTLGKSLLPHFCLLSNSFIPLYYKYKSISHSSKSFKIKNFIFLLNKILKVNMVETIKPIRNDER